MKTSDLENDSVQSTYVNILVDIIFKNYSEGVVFKDKYFRYKVANESFYKFFDIKNPKQFFDTNKIGILSDKNLQIIEAVNIAISKDYKPINYIMNIEGKDGIEKILNISSYPITYNEKFLGIISIIKDITQDENIKEKFVLKHFQLESLFENIPMIIYMQDKNSNYVVGSKHSKAFIKSAKKSLKNSDSSEIKLFNDSFNKSVSAKNKIYKSEKKITDEQGVSHWYKIYRVPVLDFNENVTGIVTLANNIDAEKQLQIQRETFVASIGHDLKNPTIAQIRSIELLLKGAFGEIKTEQKEILEMILDSCKYMNGMLSSLLATYRDYSGVITLNFEDFSLIDLVNECVSEMVYVAKDKGMKFLIDNSFSQEIIYADRVQIKRVIMNFISNGIKYAYKNSILKLNIKEKENVIFEFENESPYISEEKQKSIFAKYVSYASAHKELGIGLGLYTSKKIIEGHHGKIYVKSSKNNHNIFGFEIPQRKTQ